MHSSTLPRRKLLRKLTFCLPVAFASAARASNPCASPREVCNSSKPLRSLALAKHLSATYKTSIVGATHWVSSQGSLMLEEDQHFSTMTPKVAAIPHSKALISSLSMLRDVLLCVEISLPRALSVFLWLLSHAVVKHSAQSITARQS